MVAPSIDVVEAQYACATGCGALISKNFICNDCAAKKRKAEVEQVDIERASSLPPKDVLLKTIKSWMGQITSMVDDGTLSLPRRHWKRLEQLQKDMRNIVGDQ